MLFLFRRLRRDFQTWERPVRIGFAIAVALLLIAIVLFFVAPQEARLPITIGIGALVLTTQGIVLWGNRGMIAPITQAQRAYLAGDFDGALVALEPLYTAGKADVRALTLLGNTYRQLGRLDESAAILSEAIDKYPNHHYALYGFGRTLIVQGSYAEGAAYVEAALEAGAPEIVRFELAEAYYRLERWDDARTLLDEIVVDDEPQRLLMATFWRYKMNAGSPPERAAIEAGMDYWQAQAQRFAHTPYGAAVALEVAQLQALLDGE